MELEHPAQGRDLFLLPRAELHRLTVTGASPGDLVPPSPALPRGKGHFPGAGEQLSSCSTPPLTLDLPKASCSRLLWSFWTSCRRWPCQWVSIPPPDTCLLFPRTSLLLAASLPFNAPSSPAMISQPPEMNTTPKYFSKEERVCSGSASQAAHNLQVFIVWDEQLSQAGFIQTYFQYLEIAIYMSQCFDMVRCLDFDGPNHEQQAGRSLFPFLPADSHAQASGWEWGAPLLGKVQQPPLLSSSSAWRRGQKDPFSCLLLAASVRHKN